MNEVTDDLYDLFQMISDDEDIEKISTTISRNTESYDIIDEGKLLLLNLTNGISLAIRYRFDYYQLIFDDVSYYLLDDDHNTKMSGDRIMWYLRKIILNIKFPEDD